MTSDAEMERAVIGGIILDGITSTLADESFSTLITIDFQESDCRDAFALLMGMYSDKKDINQITIRYEMERKGMDSRLANDTVRRFIDACDVPWLAQEYVKIVRRNGYLREIRRSLLGLTAETSVENIQAIVDIVNKRDQTEHQFIIKTKDCMDGYIEALFNGKTIRVSTGFPSLDTNLHAQPGDLIVVGARAKVGKTTFLTNVLFNMLKEKVPCLYIPTEMKPDQFISRIMPLMTTVYANRFRSMEFDAGHKQEIKSAAEIVKTFPLTVLDIASPTIGEIRAAVKSSNCQVLFVDYLGRCSMTKETTRMREVERFVVALKSLCIERGIICFLAVQLARVTDHNKNTPPMLCDLSDSSAIEKEGDLILMLWKDKNKKAASYKEEIISGYIAGNRHGYTNDFDIYFEKNSMRMSEGFASALKETADETL